MFEPQHCTGVNRKTPEPHWPAKTAENNVEKDLMTPDVGLWLSRAHVQTHTE